MCVCVCVYVCVCVCVCCVVLCCVCVCVNVHVCPTAENCTISCENGGTLVSDPNTCECQCGTIYNGSDCSGKCWSKYYKK